MRHHVYVIELSKDMLLEPRFRKNNPGYIEGKPCGYVGITSEVKVEIDLPAPAP